MKIDEGQIDYSAIRTIEAIIASPYEYAKDQTNADNQRLLTLGAIRGVLDLANELKGVAKI